MPRQSATSVIAWPADQDAKVLAALSIPPPIDLVVTLSAPVVTGEPGGRHRAPEAMSPTIATDVSVLGVDLADLNVTLPWVVGVSSPPTR